MYLWIFNIHSTYHASYANFALWGIRIGFCNSYNKYYNRNKWQNIFGENRGHKRCWIFIDKERNGLPNIFSGSLFFVHDYDDYGERRTHTHTHIVYQCVCLCVEQRDKGTYARIASTCIHACNEARKRRDGEEETCNRENSLSFRPENLAGVLPSIKFDDKGTLI